MINSPATRYKLPFGSDGFSLLEVIASAAVLGMAPEEEVTVTIPANEAYGEVRDDLIQSVQKSMLPEEMKPEIGMQLMSQMPNGQQIPVTVVEVSDETITVDANHHLAGKDLTFEIKVVSVD